MSKLLSFAALLVLANSQQVTQNNCADEEGAKLTGECHDLFYTNCRTFQIEPLSTCNIITHDGVSVAWTSQYISAQYWELNTKESSSEEKKPAEKKRLRQDEEAPKEKESADAPEDCGTSEGRPPNEFASMSKKLTSGNVCGFQIQLTNLNKQGAFTVSVMTMNAITFAASSAVAVGTLLALF